jgi:hypothetical protein
MGLYSSFFSFGDFASELLLGWVRGVVEGVAVGFRWAAGDAVLPEGPAAAQGRAERGDGVPAGDGAGGEAVRAPHRAPRQQGDEEGALGAAQAAAEESGRKGGAFRGKNGRGGRVADKRSPLVQNEEGEGE